MCVGGPVRAVSDPTRKLQNRMAFRENDYLRRRDLRRIYMRLSSGLSEQTLIGINNNYINGCD